jgi:acyl-CoA synthetase (NDP forming)
MTQPEPSQDASPLAPHPSPLDRLFRRKSIAVVGASPNARFVSSILGGLFSYGYPGRIAAVNPREGA